MSEQFKGTLALVAGGTGGLGRAVSLAFLREGAKVFVTYRKQQEFDALKIAVGVKASSLDGQVVDITNEAAVQGLVETILKQNASLDILVNCVGGYAGGIKLWDLDAMTFDQMLALNLRSGFLLARAVVPAMLKQASGAIVNVVSKAAVDHAAGAAAYVASKAAALAMMNSLAADLKSIGIRANSILPSIIDTEANRKAMPTSDFSKWPKPEDIAHVILYLCSDEAKLIHGAAIPVYGES